MKIYGVRYGKRGSDVNILIINLIYIDQNEQKTKAVLSNGLNPIWNHLMQFMICIPELCLVRFSVKDNDKSNTNLGQYSIPFLSMQPGKSSKGSC